MDYIELKVKFSEREPWADIVTADLSELNFESFSEENEALLAYVQKDLYVQKDVENYLHSVLENTHFEYEIKEIADQNWNAQWESNYSPIIVDDQCIVKAPFHKMERKYPFEIIISPKMSFGTGHHNTTFLMMKSMLEIDFSGKKVLDMGAGTAVLAFLAEKKGASIIDAIDNEKWAYENMLENIELNNASITKAYYGDAAKIEELNQTYDIILANINRNILIQDMPIYSNHLVKGGLILLSGFFDSDLEMIKQTCIDNNLDFNTFNEKDHWVNAIFKKI